MYLLCWLQLGGPLSLPWGLYILIVQVYFTLPPLSRLHCKILLKCKGCYFEVVCVCKHTCMVQLELIVNLNDKIYDK